MTIEQLETARLALQHLLDGGKTQEERNKLGQFATPSALAADLMQFAVAQPAVGNGTIRFLDPAIGTGSFYSALLCSVPPQRIARAEGFEIDPWYGLKARDLWHEHPIQLHLADFTQAAPPALEEERATLVICNPPYVRHHHLSAGDKQRLQWRTEQATGIRLSGLAGLYCYFLLLAHPWMTAAAQAAWLIPSEFMDVNYGQAVKEYLLKHVRLQRIHRFDPNDMQFTDALVSSALVWFQNELPAPDHLVEFTYGGTLTEPRLRRLVPVTSLSSHSKWSQIPLATEPLRPPTNEIATLSDFLQIRRGLATGSNEFFVLTPEQAATYELPQRFLSPILPSPRYLTATEIQADASGEPLLDRKLYLLNCNLPEPLECARFDRQLLELISGQLL